jgi:uncharacterized RDD family membrane protein YckC
MGKNAPVSYGYQIQADPTNVVGKRVGAFLIDALIGTAVSVPLFFALAEKRDAVIDIFGETSRGTQYVLDGKDAAVYYLITIGLTVLIYVVLQGTQGYTPGKAALGLRTVNADGQPCGMGRAFLRTIMFIVDAAPYFIPYLVGFLVARSSPLHQRLGDKVANTYVVEKAALGIPIAVQSPAGPYGVPYGAPPPGYPQPGYPQQGQPWPAAGAPTTQWPPQPQAQPQPQPEPAAWAQPTPSQQQSQPVASDAGSPQWDEARKAYIQWDPGRQAWLQWNDTSREWRPIDT